MPNSSTTVPDRTCGSCTVCCTYLSIEQPELSKPGLTPCGHLEGPVTDGYTAESSCGSCAIYSSRPQVCQDYSCCWLQGYGDEEDRPDKSGMLVDTVRPIENCIQAKPIRKGAQDTPEGRVAVERLSRDTGKPALVAGFPETHMIRVVGVGTK